jgi:class 3 adenylate cyclase
MRPLELCDATAKLVSGLPREPDADVVDEALADPVLDPAPQQDRRRAVRAGPEDDRASAAGYHGKGVHEAARLGALAGGGEIVASVATIEVADVEYSNPRAVELKGISEPVEVVSVDWR